MNGLIDKIKSIFQNSLQKAHKTNFNKWTNKDVIDKNTSVGGNDKINKALDKGKQTLHISSPQSYRYALKDSTGFSDKESGLFTDKQITKAKESDPDIDKEGVTQHNVSSTAIDAIDYDPKSKDLGIVFKGGKKEYIYPNVPKEAVKALLQAASKGRHVNTVIKPNYSVAKKK